MPTTVSLEMTRPRGRAGRSCPCLPASSALRTHSSPAAQTTSCPWSASRPRAPPTPTATSSSRTAALERGRSSAASAATRAPRVREQRSHMPVPPVARPVTLQQCGAGNPSRKLSDCNSCLTLQATRRITCSAAAAFPPTPHGATACGGRPTRASAPRHVFCCAALRCAVLLRSLLQCMPAACALVSVHRHCLPCPCRSRCWSTLLGSRAWAAAP